ncbi:MAG: transcription antitermination factor NusB [Candidatus Dojkabacteria bacterium]
MKNSKHLDKHLSRVLAVQFLYSKLINEREHLETTPFEPNSLLEEMEVKKYDNNLYVSIVDAVTQHKDKIDEVINRLAPEYAIADINPVNLTILRGAIAEAFINQTTPAPIVIDEAIELKKDINPDESSSSFINGVLGAILKDESILDDLSALKKAPVEEAA